MRNKCDSVALTQMLAATAKKTLQLIKCDMKHENKNNVKPTIIYIFAVKLRIG